MSEAESRTTMTETSLKHNRARQQTQALTAGATYKETARRPPPSATAPRMYFKPCCLVEVSPKQHVRQRTDFLLDLRVRFSMCKNFKFDRQLQNNFRARLVCLECDQGIIVHSLRICRSRSKSIESVQFSSKRSDSRKSLVRIRFCAHSHLKTDRQSRS